MKLYVEPSSRPLSGTITVPGDKSIGHRALLFSLLSTTPVRVRGLSDGADNGRSAKAIMALGARIERDEDAFVIHGTGPGGMRAPDAPIDCGNSGTTMRLLCGMLAGQRFATTLVGDASLSKRPMRRVIDPLARMGAQIRGQRREGGTHGPSDVTPPLIVGPATAPLHAFAYTLPIASAQVKTAVLLAALYGDGPTSVTEPGPSRDHSERMLAHLGAPIVVEGRTTTLDTTGWDHQLACDELEVPADPSSAAFLVAAALVVGADEVRLPGVCINPTRTGFLDAITAMGGHVAVEEPRPAGPETVADLVIRGAAAELRGVTIGGDLAVRSIDELPILAVLAARARGTTVVRDAEELRVKESDRVAATCTMLSAFGVSCETRPDGFVIEGRGDAPLSPARVHADGDHRIAMSAAIAGLVATGRTEIDDADQVATSYPGFAEALTALGATISSAG